MSDNKERKKLLGLSSDDVEETWVKYYSSHHQILLVGEGDFSFSLCLAQSFGSALNIVASSLDTYDQVVRKYKMAMSNLVALTKLGAFVLHGVDATQMEHHPDLFVRIFDRIIFNFPHAGFHGSEGSSSMIQRHKNLLRCFFMNARTMLKPDGEIHINHKITPPFDDWCIEELGIQNLLWPIECVEFKKEDYPGYNNKRGDGPRCDEPFPLGECSTFKFALLTKKESNPTNQGILSCHHNPQRSSLGSQSSLTSCRDGHPQIFGEGGDYLNNEIEILGRGDFGYVGGTTFDSQKSSVFRYPETDDAINIDMRSVKQVSSNVHGKMDVIYGRSVFEYVHGISCDLQRRSWLESSNDMHLTPPTEVFGKLNLSEEIKENLVTNMVIKFGEIELEMFKPEYEYSFKFRHVINKFQQVLVDNFFYAAKTKSTRWTVAALDSLTHYFNNNNRACYVVTTGKYIGVYAHEEEIFSLPDELDEQGKFHRSLYTPCENIVEALAIVKGKTLDFYVSPKISYQAQLPIAFENYLKEREQIYNKTITAYDAFLDNLEDDNGKSFLEHPSAQLIKQMHYEALLKAMPRNKQEEDTRLEQALLAEESSEECVEKIPDKAKEDPNKMQQANMFNAPKEKLVTSMVVKFGETELELFKPEYSFKSRHVINNVQQVLVDNLFYAAMTKSTIWTVVALHSLAHYWSNNNGTCYAVSSGKYIGVYAHEEEIFNLPDELDEHGNHKRSLYTPCDNIFEALAIVNCKTQDFYVSPKISYQAQLPIEFENYLKEREQVYNETIAAYDAFLDNLVDGNEKSLLEHPSAQLVKHMHNKALSKVVPRIRCCN